MRGYAGGECAPRPSPGGRGCSPKATGEGLPSVSLLLQHRSPSSGCSAATFSLWEKGTSLFLRPRSPSSGRSAATFSLWEKDARSFFEFCRASSHELKDRLAGFRGSLQPDQPLAPIVWFRAGGPAEILALPADAEDLAFLMRAVPEEIPVTVFGLGSNLLVRDGGVEGVVVRLTARGFGKVEVDGARLRVGAALADKRVAAHALEAGIGGFAFYHGIPGGIGGALRMNAGANGAETCERVVEVVAIDRRGERHVLLNAGMGYSYRHAAVPDDFIFVEAVYEGVAEDRETIRAAMNAVQEHRERAQPVKAGPAARPSRTPTRPARRTSAVPGA